MSNTLAASCTITLSGDGRALRLPSVRITAKQPDGRSVAAALELGPCVVGSSPDCDIVLVDPQVSRRHCELRLTERGIALRDLGSKNGVTINGVAVAEAWLDAGAVALIGGTEVRVETSGVAAMVPLSAGEAFGDAVGRSLPMRALFDKLERAAPLDETVLLLGESGTGKEVLARALHAKRRGGSGPFVVIDCGAIAPSVIESELFGHARGAFTGANSDRAGLLEQANGGTLFIDELGELPPDLQPKLLRAIEARQIRRVGDNHVRSFDARIVAATHRNLRARAQEGTFRSDLYFRLSVVEVHVPPLRDRKDDIALLVARFLAERDPPCTLDDLPARSLDLLRSYDWPGNVRELRNVVVRLLLFPEMAAEIFGPGAVAGAAQGASPAPAPQDAGAQAASPAGEARLDKLLELTLPAAREAVLEAFERAYIAEKLRRYEGNIKRTAAAIGVSRQLVHRMLERYDLRAR